MKRYKVTYVRDDANSAKYMEELGLDRWENGHYRTCSPRANSAEEAHKIAKALFDKQNAHIFHEGKYRPDLDNKYYILQGVEELD